MTEKTSKEPYKQPGEQTEKTEAIKEKPLPERNEQETGEKPFVNELKICREQKDEYLAGWQRAKADFLNYKKEEAERVTALVQYGQAGLILNILPVLDNLELLKKNLSPDLRDNHCIKGVFQIKKQIIGLLKNLGVERIKGEGERFNPELHEVVEEVRKEEEEPGIIIEILQHGYLLNGRVLRPARVKIAGKN